MQNNTAQHNTLRNSLAGQGGMRARYYINPLNHQSISRSQSPAPEALAGGPCPNRYWVCTHLSTPTDFNLTSGYISDIETTEARVLLWLLWGFQHLTPVLWSSRPTPTIVGGNAERSLTGCWRSPFTARHWLNRELLLQTVKGRDEPSHIFFLFPDRVLRHGLTVPLFHFPFLPESAVRYWPYSGSELHLGHRDVKYRDLSHRRAAGQLAVSVTCRRTSCLMPASCLPPTAETDSNRLTQRRPCRSGIFFRNLPSEAFFSAWKSKTRRELANACEWRGIRPH